MLFIFGLTSCELFSTPTPVVETVEVPVTREVVITQDVIITKEVKVTKEIIVTATQVPTLTYTPMPEVILEDDFDMDEGDWMLEFLDDDPKGYAEFTDGELQFGIAAEHETGSYAFTHPKLETLKRGYDLSVDTRLVEGDALNTELQITTRYLDKTDFLLFGMTQNGWYNFSTWSEDQWWYLIPWTREPAIKRGINNIRIIDDGTRFRAYINGTILFNIPLEYPPVGFVSFGITSLVDEEGQPPDAGGTWAIDNLVVREVE